MLGPFVEKDGIPPIDDPERVGVMSADYPEDGGRVVEVVVGNEAIAYPIGILTYHEIVNDEVGGVPVSVTYCPLCDSASVLDRRMRLDDGSEAILEFGVSGFLLNSNVVMYERTTNGLWSQVLMKGLTGPYAGKSVRHIPVSVISLRDFKRRHPKGEVQTTNTGHERDYTRNIYAERGYFSDKTSVPDRFAFDYDDRIAPKELGVGVYAGGEAYFVIADAIRDEKFTLATPKGDVVMIARDAGVEILKAPEGAHTMQTFYHSWSAFHPRTEIIPAPADSH